MKIWLATVGEPLITDPGKPRLLRTGQFAQWLSDRGHDVTFITGTMDHYGRRLRAQSTTTIEISENYRIIALAGRLYTKSISFARFRNHSDVANSFRTIAKDLAPPDIILASYPTEELCRVLAEFAEFHKIPIVMDARDFWPDIFSEMLPQALNLLSSVLFGWMNKRAKSTLARATALCGMTNSAMEWATKKAGRQKKKTDFWFPFTYTNSTKNKYFDKNKYFLDFVFLGTLSKRSNLETIIDAFCLAENKKLPFRLHICGSGEAEDILKERASGKDTIIFHGWLDSAGIAAIMEQCDFGVLPYNRPDFHLSLPNKFAEYLSGGLPILTCTDGEVKRMIVQRNCGVWAPSSPEALLEALVGLDRDRVAALQANATAVFQDTFAPDAVFEKALNGLTSVLEAFH